MGLVRSQIGCAGERLCGLKISATCRFRRSHNRCHASRAKGLSNASVKASTIVPGKRRSGRVCPVQLPSKNSRPAARRSIQPVSPPPIFSASPRRPHGAVSTSALSLPRKLIGSETVVHTRRPEALARLSEVDAALLDFLRRGGKNSELPPSETIDSAAALLSESGRFERLLKVVDSEPPRVRAIFGAIGEQIGKPPDMTQRLRASLNPFSKFDFGLLTGLPSAKHWQAKGIMDEKQNLGKTGKTESERDGNTAGGVK